MNLCVGLIIGFHIGIWTRYKHQNKIKIFKTNWEYIMIKYDDFNEKIYKKFEDLFKNN